MKRRDHQEKNYATAVLSIDCVSWSNPPRVSCFSLTEPVIRTSKKNMCVWTENKKKSTVDFKIRGPSRRQEHAIVFFLVFFSFFLLTTEGTSYMRAALAVGPNAWIHAYHHHHDTYAILLPARNERFSFALASKEYAKGRERERAMGMRNLIDYLLWNPHHFICPPPSDTDAHFFLLLPSTTRSFFVFIYFIAIALPSDSFSLLWRHRALCVLRTRKLRLIPSTQTAKARAFY